MVRTIDSYIIGKTLGEGASAKVKLGTNQDTGERVALKLVRPEAILGGDTSRLVQREIDAMLNLRHRNVLCIKKVNYEAQYPKKNGQIVSLVLIVIEFAAGGELFEFLAATGPFDEIVARSYFRQLMQGVGYCHSQNVVHRDLKPENLLFDEQFVLKIADFGFSKVGESSQCMFTQCGSPGYMAPEVLTRDGYDARKSDLWACGVILFIMVAGFPPFQKPDISDWWFEKLHTGNGDLFWKAHSRTVNVSDALKQLILDILCTDPALRLSAQEVLQSEWMQGPTMDQTDLNIQLHTRQTMVVHEQERAKLIAQHKKEQSDPDASVLNKKPVSIPTMPQASSSNNKSHNNNSNRTTLVMSAVAVAGAAVAACALAFFSSPAGGGGSALSASPSASASSFVGFGPSVPFSRVLSPSANFFSVLSHSGSITALSSSSSAISSSSSSSLGGSPLSPPGASGVAAAAITLLAASVTTGVAWASKKAASTRRRRRQLTGLELYSSQLVNFSNVESDADAAVLFNVMKKWVTKQHPAHSQFTPAKFKLKATVNVEGQDISFRAQVFKSDKQNNSRVVEVVRMHGDSIQFRVLFGELKSELER